MPQIVAQVSLKTENIQFALLLRSAMISSILIFRWPYLLIRAPFGESDPCRDLSAFQFFLSIHAPHGESDRTFQDRRWRQRPFNSRSRVESDTMDLFSSLELLVLIHAPRGESDPSNVQYCAVTLTFDSRSPCGERSGTAHLNRSSSELSIHALYGKSDRAHDTHIPASRPFNSHFS